MSRILFALLILTVFVLRADSTDVDSTEILCTGDTGTIDPSHQSIIDRVIQLLQGKRSTKFVIRLIKKRVTDPNSKLRRLLGSSAADPRDPNEDLDEAPMTGTIDKDTLDMLDKVKGRTRSVVSYLWHYGFLPKVLGLSKVPADNYKGRIPPCAMTNAIKEFQRFNHLEPLNGKLNKEVRDLMAKDRCGNPDVECDTPECLAEDEAARIEESFSRKKRYVVKSRKWLDQTGDGLIVLKYHFDPEHMYNPSGPNKRNHDQNMGVEIVRKQIENGLESWAKYAPIHFVEVDDVFDADVKIKFGKDGHEESSTRAYFDGQYGILAHMYYPRSGKMHFDEAENFTASAIGPGINLEFVAAHEMGHGLGIKHSNVANALMGPFYWGYKEDMLEADDIAAVQALYGSEGVGSVVPLSQQRQCVAGERRDNFRCVKCPVNTFSETEDANECTACPRGETTAATGTSSADHCTLSETENEEEEDEEEFGAFEYREWDEEEFGALENPEWLDVNKGAKIQIDMGVGSLQVKSSADLNSNKEISLSLLSDQGWIGSFRMFYRNGDLLFTLKHCTPSQRGNAQPQTIPSNGVTGTDDVFDITITSEALLVSVNGVNILDYKFSEGAGAACANKYRQQITGITFWKADSASESYRHISFAV